MQGAANKLALAANPNIGMSPHKIFMVYYDPDIDGLDFDGFSQELHHVMRAVVNRELPGLCFDLYLRPQASAVWSE
eukprot:871258-Pelagomonas_calceolata.AAC.3